MVFSRRDVFKNSFLSAFVGILTGTKELPIAAVNSGMPFRPAFESNAYPIAGAQAVFTTTGTTTLAPIYTSSALTSEAQNPVSANGSGRFPQTFLDSTITYRLRIFDKDADVATATPLEDFDPYEGQERGSKGFPASPDQVYGSRTDISALTPSNLDVAKLTEVGREGLFAFSNADLSAFVSADTLQGVYIAPDSDNTGASGAWIREHDGRLDVAWFGAANDGTTDDRNALTVGKNLILALNTRNPTWSNKAVLCQHSDANTFLPGGLDLHGIGRIDFQGIITMAAASDELEYGMLSVLGELSNYKFTQVKVGKLVATGVMNGQSTIQSAVELVLRADTTGTTKKSCAYSDYYLGSCPTITLDTIDGPNGSAYINENRFYNGRTYSITIGGDYPCNQNHFYGMKMESCTVNITNGFSNYFHDTRLEGTCNFKFAAGTYDNWVIQTYYPLRESYYRQNGSDSFTIIDSGRNNHIIEGNDAYHRHDVVWEASPNSRSFDASKLTRNERNLTFVGNYQSLFDSGLVKLENALCFFIEAAGTSSQSLFSPFLYMFDRSGTHIKADPGSDFTSIINGTFSSADGDPLNLPGYFKTTAALNNIALPCYTGTNVAFVRLVIRTSGIVNGTDLDFMRVIKTELEKNHTPVKPVIPFFVNDYSFSGAASETAVPTAGNWKVGDVVKNTNSIQFGSSPDKYEIVQWRRMTDGSSHVLNIDWRQHRFLTGAP